MYIYLIYIFNNKLGLKTPPPAQKKKTNQKRKSKSAAFLHKMDSIIVKLSWLLLSFSFHTSS